MKETTTGTLQKPNIEPEIMLVILRYIYTGSVELSNTNVIQVLAAGKSFNIFLIFLADEMQLNELKSFCADHVKENIDTDSALYLLDLAYRYYCDDLVACCYDYIRKNSDKVLKDSSKFITLSKKTMEFFLSSEDIGVDEIQIFSALIHWGLNQITTPPPKIEENDWRNVGFQFEKTGKTLCEHDRKLLRMNIKDLVPLIRFPLMNANQLIGKRNYSYLKILDLVEPYGVVDDYLLLEAYRHLAAVIHLLQILI